MAITAATEHIPKVLETPKEDNWDEKNLATLRSLI
jgi:hypothetical protein